MWGQGPGDVSWAKLAFDFEVYLGKALPASPHPRVWGTQLPLQEHAHVLRQAMQLVRRHLAVGQLLRGLPLENCCALILLGGRGCWPDNTSRRGRRWRCSCICNEASFSEGATRRALQ